MAFSADPVCRWAYPDPHVYYKDFPPFIRAFAGGAFEAPTAYVSENYEGAALWLPPGVHAEEEALGAIIAESVSDELQESLFELVELQAATNPAEPHWYLPLIGCDPINRQRNRLEAPGRGAARGRQGGAPRLPGSDVTRQPGAVRAARLRGGARAEGQRFTADVADAA
jgi:hypothetical protein